MQGIAGGEDEDGDAGGEAAQAGKQVQPVGVRQTQVEEDERGDALAKVGLGFGGGGGEADFVAVFAQAFFEAAGHHGVVFHDEDGVHGRTLHLKSGGKQPRVPEQLFMGFPAVFGVDWRRMSP